MKYIYNATKDYNNQITTIHQIILEKAAQMCI